MSLVECTPVGVRETAASEGNIHIECRRGPHVTSNGELKWLCAKRRKETEPERR